jgi:hypothetical protein
MKSKLLIVSMFIAISFIAVINKDEIIRAVISINVNVKISQNIADNYYKPNNVLFITVKNSKDVPIGFKKIIGPQYPLKINIKGEDILFPSLVTFKLKLVATMNFDGQIGELKKGDYYSSKIREINLFCRQADIEIDKIK